MLYDVVDRQGLRDGLPWGVIRHLDLSDDVRELSRPLPRCGLVRVQTYAATPRRVQQLDDDTVRVLRDAHEAGPAGHVFERHPDPQFGSYFGGGCGHQDGHGVTCGWPERAHAAEARRDPIT